MIFQCAHLDFLAARFIADFRNYYCVIWRLALTWICPVGPVEKTCFLDRLFNYRNAVQCNAPERADTFVTLFFQATQGFIWS